MHESKPSLERFVEVANLAVEKRYAWTRQMLTLSSGALTLLVALHKSFVPDAPQYVWLLKACWIGLGLSIVTAATVLHGESAHLKELALSAFRCAQEAAKTGQDPLKLTGAGIARIYIVANNVFPWLLAASLCFLVAFALFNIG